MYAGSVRIGAIDYKISTSEQLSKHHGLDGQIAYDSAEITVNGGTEPQRQYAILLHEIIHGILTAAKAESCFADDDAQEKAVDIMAYGVLGLIRDNPELIQEIGEVWQPQR